MKILVLANKPIEKPSLSEGFSIGLPERIRTFDLQSRSLTRYPAVPRVGMKFYHIIIAYLRKKSNPFFKKSRGESPLFGRRFSPENLRFAGG